MGQSVVQRDESYLKVITVAHRPVKSNIWCSQDIKLAKEAMCLIKVWGTDIIKWKKC